MIVVVSLLAACLFVGGVVAVVVGVRPPLARLDRRVDQVLGGQTAGAGPGAVPWRRWRDRLAAATPDEVLPDLVLLGKVRSSKAADPTAAPRELDEPGSMSTADFALVRIGWAAGSAAFLTVLAGWVGAAPTLLPIVATAGAAGGWVIAVEATHDRANTHRRTFALALASWTQMSALMIRAGMKDEQAMRRAAGTSRHWTFRLLTGAMDRAVANQQPLWTGLEALGQQIDVDELRHVAADLRLTDIAGGTPADALLARADALRQDELAAQLVAARAAKLKQEMALAGLGLVMVGFVLYPALATFIESDTSVQIVRTSTLDR